MSLTFDDGYDSHYTSALPLLETYNMQGTFYLTTSFLEKPGYLTKTQVISLFQQGHEIASHGVTHRNFKKLSPFEIEKELRHSKLALETLLSSPITSFAPPFGFFHPHLMYLIKKHYRTNRTITPRLNAIHQIYPLQIQSHVVFHSTALCEVEEWIDQSVREKKWLVLVYHQIDDTETIVSVSKNTFESHLQAIQKRNITTLTIQEMIFFLENKNK